MVRGASEAHARARGVPTHARLPAPLSRAAVYVDEGKSAYKALSYKRQSTFWGILSLLSSEVRAGVQRTKDKGISGNFAEDGMQVCRPRCSRR